MFENSQRCCKMEEVEAVGDSISNSGYTADFPNWVSERATVT
jgi:hypothetical protein